MSKLKVIILTFIVLSLTGCQLASSDYFRNTNEGEFIGLALNFRKAEDHDAENNSIVVYVVGDGNKLDISNESHIVETVVHIEGENSTKTTVEVNVYTDAYGSDYIFSFSGIYDQQGTIVYETVSQQFLFEAELMGSLTYEYDKEDTFTNTKESLDIKVNLKPELIDKSFTLYEFDTNYQLENTINVESIHEVAPTYDFFILESIKSDGSVFRQMGSKELISFREGEHFLIYEYAVTE